MGAWGAKLYENDDALDIKDRFDDLHKGKTVDEITKELIDEFSSAMDDIYCAPIFWFVLADTQWKLGRLLPEVKEQALEWLDKGGDLAVWEQENPKLAITRKKVLEELRLRLNSPQPPEKKISQHRLYKCEWKIGDVFAYQLESDLAKDKGLFGRYFLFQKVDEGTWHPGHTIPIVRVKLTEDKKLPATATEYDNLEYVQTSFTTYSDRFLPIDGRRPSEDIAEKSKLKYEVDEYGYLPKFRIELISTSKMSIPKKLIYIGNFSNILPPDKEFVPHDKINLSAMFWDKFNETIEIHLIKRYFNFNKRQGRIYNLKGSLWNEEINKYGFEQCKEQILAELDLVWHLQDFNRYIDVYKTAENYFSGSELFKTRFEFAVKMAAKNI